MTIHANEIDESNEVVHMEPLLAEGREIKQGKGNEVPHGEDEKDVQQGHMVPTPQVPAPS